MFTLRINQHLCLLLFFLNQSLQLLKYYNSNLTKMLLKNDIAPFSRPSPVSLKLHIYVALSPVWRKRANSNHFVKNSSKFCLFACRRWRAVCFNKSLNYVPVFDCRPHTESLWTIESHLMDKGLKSTSALKLRFFNTVKDFEACVMYAKLLSNYFL